MGENKQYVTQNQECGTVMISENVIATIIIQEITEVEGVVGLSVKPGADIADLIGKKTWGKGLKVTILADESIDIECNIVVEYAQNVVIVAQAVQEAVINAVESASSVKVNTVNVNVSGIERR